jgi:predicted HAD superfamily Cof-like phosphohydrolase
MSRISNKSTMSDARQGFDAASSLIEEFYAAMSEDIPNEPTELSSETVNARCKWLHDEVDELGAAEDLISQIDAVCDILYFAVGTFVMMGVRPGLVFREVHAANMRKIPDSGLAPKHKDGKFKKPQDWEGPEEALRQLLESGRLGRS